jgi:hypothetical protein
MSGSLRLNHLFNLAALLLLVVSLFGPWGTSGDGVPPPEWCEAPNFLINDGSRCVRYLPGTEIFFYMLSGLFAILASVFTGATVFSSDSTFMEALRQIVFILVFFFLLLPFANSLVLHWLMDTPRKRAWVAACWGLAIIPALLIGGLEMARSNLVMWGVWLFTAVVVSMLILEVARLYATIHRKSLA